MSVVFDKLLSKPLLHKHKASDISDGDDRWVNVSGDTMEGDLIFPVTGFIMTDSNGEQWRVTIGTDGTLTTTMIQVDNLLLESGDLLLLENGNGLGLG